MSQTDSNAFNFAEDEGRETIFICAWCNSDPCDCEINDEPSMLTDDDLLED